MAGLTRRQLKGIQAIAGRALGYKSSQQGSTATLAITGGHYSLRAVRFRVEVIFQWLEIVFSDDFDIKPAIRAWGIARAKQASSTKPWSLVAGPLQATIATPSELGWQPLTPFPRVDEEGRAWDTSYTEL